jgi:hypothetical protein
MIAVVVGCAGSACAQATHDAFVWIEGPGAVTPGSTFTLDVWGRFESPAFVDGVSAIAGFGMDVICTAGRDEVVSVDGPDGFGGIVLESGFAAGPDLLEVRGGQLANLFGILNPTIDLSQPMHLFSFEVTVGDFTQLAFTPANPGPDGGLSFYPDSTDGGTIVAPNDADTTLTMVGWSYEVPGPGPGGMAVVAVAVVGRGRRR